MKTIKIMIIVVIVIIIALIYSLFVILNDNKGMTDNTKNIINNSNDIIVYNNIDNNKFANSIVIDKNNLVNKDEAQMSEFEEEVIINPNAKPVTSATRFYTIEICIQRYFDAIANKNSTELFGILNSDYINSKQVTEENILNYVHKLANFSNFTALEMSVLEGTNTETYIVYGTILSRDQAGIGNDVFFIVDLGRHSNTFSITPLIEYDYNNIKQINIVNKDIEIQKNGYNNFSYYKINDEDLIKKYISNYKINVIYNTRQSYYLLDKEYREKRFKNIDEYEQYIKDNIDTIRTSILNRYRVIQEDDIIRYDYIDNNENHYVLKETAVMQYTILLDDYTVLTQKEIDEYNKLNDAEKATYNARKFVKMINSRDYEKVYNILDKTFRNNNFKDLESFKKYILENTYKYNELVIKDSDDTIQEYNVLVCNLKNVNNEEESKPVTIIINLLEDTNFTMSFSFQ